QERCAFVVGQIGPKAKPAVAPLVIVAKSKSLEARIEAAHALWKIDASWIHLAVEALIEGLGHKNPIVREDAGKKLGGIGAGAHKALAALEHVAAKDSVEYVRSAAREAIAKIKRNGNAPVE